MTGEGFKKLVPDSEIEMDGKAYVVQETDRMGRVKMVQLEYYIDEFDYRDETFDTYEDADDYLNQLIQELEDDLQAGVYEYDKEEKDKAEENLDTLRFADIESEECGSPFWMHYKDIKED